MASCAFKRFVSHEWILMCTLVLPSIPLHHFSSLSFLFSFSEDFLNFSLFCQWVAEWYFFSLALGVDFHMIQIYHILFWLLQMFGVCKQFSFWRKLNWKTEKQSCWEHPQVLLMLKNISGGLSVTFSSTFHLVCSWVTNLSLCHTSLLSCPCVIPCHLCMRCLTL